MTSSAQLALARSHTFQLFSQLFLRGLQDELLVYVQAIPELATALPAVHQADEAAAEHHHLFGFNVFPYESVFLDPESLLGGRVTEQVLESYRRAGFAPGTLAHRGDNADHVGVELALLSFLCGAEAQAWQDGLLDRALRMRGLQRRFLDEHLLRWLPGLAQAIRQQSSETTFYTALADLLSAFVLAHRIDLEDGVAGNSLPFVLPAPPALLDDQGTGLKEIARYLVTPAYSGLYLSRDDIGRLGRAQRLPRGFGERRTLLTNLLQAAATYHSLPAVFEQLQRLVARWQDAYTDEQGSGVPALAAVGRVWAERLGATEKLIQRLARAADRPNL